MAGSAKILATVLLATVGVPFLLCIPLLAAETGLIACHLNHRPSSQPMNHACCSVNRPSSFLPSAVSHAPDVLISGIISASGYFIPSTRRGVENTEQFPGNSPPLTTPLRI